MLPPVALGLVALAAVSTLTGCRTTPDEPPRTVVVVPAGNLSSPPTSPGGELALDAPDASAPAPAPTAVRPNVPGGLGLPCTAERPPPGVPSSCGTQNRVSMRWEPHPRLFTRGQPGCQMKALGQDAMLNADRMGCVSKGKVWALAVCAMCRIDRGWSVVAEIAEMTGEQSSYLQGQLGLGGSLGVSEAAWAKALAVR